MFSFRSRQRPEVRDVKPKHKSVPKACFVHLLAFYYKVNHMTKPKQGRLLHPKGKRREMNIYWPTVQSHRNKLRKFSEIFLPTPIYRCCANIHMQTHILIFKYKRSLSVHTLLFVPFRELFQWNSLLICLINNYRALAMCQTLFYKYNSNIGAEISWGMLSGEAWGCAFRLTYQKWDCCSIINSHNYSLTSPESVHWFTLPPTAGKCLLLHHRQP